MAYDEFLLAIIIDCLSRRWKELEDMKFWLLTWRLCNTGLVRCSRPSPNVFVYTQDTYIQKLYNSIL